MQKQSYKHYKNEHNDIVCIFVCLYFSKKSKFIFYKKIKKIRLLGHGTEV